MALFDVAESKGVIDLTKEDKEMIKLACSIYSNRFVAKMAFGYRSASPLRYLLKNGKQVRYPAMKKVYEMIRGEMEREMDLITLNLNKADIIEFVAIINAMTDCDGLIKRLADLLNNGTKNASFKVCKSCGRIYVTLNDEEEKCYLCRNSS